MARAKNGQAISKPRRTLAAVAKLRKFAKTSQRSDPHAWRRAVVVLAYINRKRVVELAETFQVGRSTINEWLRGYEAAGVDGLVTRKPPGAAPRLTEEQRQELIDLIESGPMAAGFTSGVWTGPIIGQLIRKQFGVNYHNHHVPRLLHSLGFSVQRPRKRLARADLAAQEYWLRERFPSIKKKARSCRGVVLFEDEASFWLDGTLHSTWSRVGVQPRVNTYGQRKTAHVFATVQLSNAALCYQFASVFNGETFLGFLQLLVRKYKRQKVFLIIDNAPCHNLGEKGRQWLQQNRHRIELHRLPSYSPEFNPVEGMWKATRKYTTHNRFYETVEERDTALRATFTRFQRKPQLIAAHVRRFQ